MAALVETIEVLEQAIKALREVGEVDVPASACRGVANDLALLHGSLTAELRRNRLRMVKAEEIAAEVMHGQHREDD